MTVKCIVERFCHNAASQNLSAEYDDCVRMSLGLSSRDQASSDVICSSFMTSLMAEFVSGALRTSVLIIINEKTL